MLSEEESDTESIHRLTINEHFAKAYEYRKEREELAKLKEKYGSDVDDADVGGDEDDSEEDESEDEDGEELTPAVDAAILRTLARIRKRDPAIYESGKDIFEEERQKTNGAAPVARSKPLTMRQHALASALSPSSRSPSPEPLTHVAEQAALRKETISAFHGAVSGAKVEDEEDDFLVPREKTKDEVEREEEEYRDFLQREVGDDLREIVTLDAGAATNGAEGEVKVEEGKEKKKKKKKKEDAKGHKNKDEEDQEFLMNYILNRGWLDRSARRLPTYKEIVGSKKGAKGKGKARDGGSSSSSASEHEQDVRSEDDSSAGSGGEPLDEDEDEFDEVADRFESSYNFRFEEPGADAIPRYPRNIDSLVRRQDTARKEAREKRKARKEEEMLKKREEVKRLKSLKMKDLQARLEMIGKEGGKSLASKALQKLDLEGDWDPDAHDRQMAELYEREVEADAMVDDEKPTWDDIDITDIAPPDDDEDGAQASSSKKKKKKKKKDEDVADEGGVDIDEMDAAVERAPADEEEWDGTEETRKRVLEKYMDELYGLEFNDMVGDMPTRFKYARVEPQAFGLSPVEILTATDPELNQFMGIKKYAPYRKEGKGKTWDGQRTARLKELREKLKDRGVELSEGGAGRERERAEKPKKRKGKKERMKEKAAAIGAGVGETDGGEGDVYEGEDVEHSAGRKAKRRKVEERSSEVGDGADEPENADGQDASTKKKRRRHKKSHHAAG
ncbi:KRI1-like family C-terminal-domain-containing protein [Fomitopsis serialis]|uniref:KRI1-like family C-terminal-domain-containing protein n=1 Tax=Fomitopsis serialis TaxID=139415 RepID=UPI002007D687|nr:KRI1-like family C-terminal-domain-containing protein [Neoantrodia serialis]KAH9915495.1 KRI1-like family C-terminal-domain-containing protein [Neoantrodia serialis]